MHIGNAFHSSDLTIHFYHSLVTGGQVIGSYSDMTEWQHTIQAFGGFWEGSFSRQMSIEEMQDWFENGLGRQIIVTDHELTVLWEGFVDQVSVSIAGLEVSRGPLTDVANRVDVVYSTFDGAFTPPIPGIRAKAGAVANTVSQDVFGVFSRIYSAAGLTAVNAAQLRDVFIDEHKDPEITSSFSFSGQGTNVEVKCKGYVQLMHYPFNKLAPGFVNLSTKITDVLIDEPNNFISRDFSHIITNTTQMIRWENDDADALSVIKGLVAQGDNANLRYLFGIYENRQAYYYPAPDTTIDYRMKLTDPSRTIYDTATNIIYPWKIRPGKWLTFDDFFPGFIPFNSDLRSDPRNLFIESVAFHTPNDYTLTGGKVTKFEQKLARFGIAGIAS